MPISASPQPIQSSAKPNPDLALDLTHVSKTYKGKIRALQGIDMQIRRGEIFGLLGPNGAGKSTLVKILMTVIRPTQAKGTMLGAPIGHKPTLARVGYLPEHHRFPDYLTGSQVLDFYAAMGKVTRKDRRKRSAELLDMVGMTAWGSKRVRSYSKGMRQRVGIAQALMNDPDFVVLDEPTDGVDPVGRRDIRAILSRVRDEGRTVLLNSHLLSELEMVCDRVAILVQGQVQSQGTIDELTRDQQYYLIEVLQDDENAGAEATIKMLPASVARLEEHEKTGAGSSFQSSLARRIAYRGTLASGEWIEIDRNILRLGTTSPQTIQPLIDGLRERGAVIKAIRQFRPSLEDLFMQAVTDPTTGHALLPGAAQDGGKHNVQPGARP